MEPWLDGGWDSLRLPSARRWAARDRAIRAGTGGTAVAVDRPFVHVTAGNQGQVGMRRDQWGDGGATCKIAGIAYTGSNPVPATLPLAAETRLPAV